MRELASPAAPASLAPSLFAAPDGRVLLSWVEPLAAGFVAFAPLDAERTGILFLDGRQTKRGDGPTQLRFAAVSREAPPELP